MERSFNAVTPKLKWPWCEVDAHQMIRKHMWLVFAAIGAIGLIGVAAHAILSSTGSASESVTLVKPLACASCGHRYQGPISRPPLKCQACGQETVWPALKCVTCGTVVACDRQKFRREGRDPYCPKCSSTQLASLPVGG